MPNDAAIRVCLVLLESFDGLVHGDGNFVIASWEPRFKRLQEAFTQFEKEAFDGLEKEKSDNKEEAGSR